MSLGGTPRVDMEPGLRARWLQPGAHMRICRSVFPLYFWLMSILTHNHQMAPYL